MRPHRRAFTLIELLVVIAIIAILAAILFPVFAQAKESAKKTTSLSNAKQQGTAVTLYTTDNDDLYPMATLNNNGVWRPGYLVPTPYNAVTNGGWDTTAAQAQTAGFWSNSTDPYRKSYKMLEGGDNRVELSGATYLNGTKPEAVGLTMNGLMNVLSTTEIPAPSSAVLLWGGQGNTSVYGRATSSPELNCSATTGATCRFNASAMPDGTTSGTSGTVFYSLGISSYKPWMWGQTVPIVRADTSAKSRRVGVQVNADSSATARNYDYWNDPYSRVYPSSTSGYSRGYYTCNTGDDSDSTVTVYYYCFFRPDRTK